MSTGGSRWAVMRPLALEALIVAAVGGVLAISGAHFIVSWLGANLDARGQVPYWADFGLSSGLVGFAVALMAGATLVAGVAPAIRTTRVDLAKEMQKEGRGGSVDRIPVLSTLVATEVALACVLLVTSAFIVRAALATVQRVGAFPLDGVLTAELLLESYAYPDTAARQLFWSDLDRLLDDDPGVDAFTMATAMPGDGTSDAWIALEGLTYDRPEDWPRSQRRVVSPDFFGMFGMDVADGRIFTDADGFDAPRVAVVNDAWVEEHLQGVSPVGRELRVRERNGDPVAYEIVGQVHDPGVSVDDGERVAAVFLPVAQRQPSSLLVGVRMLPGARRPLEALTEAVRSLDAELPLDNTMTLEAIVRRENDGGRIMGLLFGSLGLAALLLAIVGLHGVVAFNAAQRVHAIGVMRALGAPESSVLRDVLVRGLRPVAIGLVAGMALAWLLTPILGREMLEGEGGGPHDPLIFALVPLILLAGAVVAAGRPALHASRIDPVAALKAD
ncbi:MAG: FtsX-like permease family protein [Gemmatimonadota bacterium]